MVLLDLELLISETNTNISCNSLPVLHGVPFQLHQLFLNLITNAIKFRHPNRTPKIRIECAPMDRAQLPEELLIKNRDYVCLIFSDNGVGFTTEQASKIFEVFKRLNPTRGEGTGIGLAIVKKVALNHDGYVLADATPDHGAQFKVFLPAN